MYKPTKEMSENAQRGLKMREAAPPSNKGGTAVGLARANQFANREYVSLDIVKRTYSFLKRAEIYYRSGENTPGTQAFLLWGGYAALAWSEKILEKIKEQEDAA